MLNDRPNVSRKAVRQVNEAIDRIGFVRNPAAVSLARNKSYRFRFVLPNSGDLYLRELIQRVEELKLALKGDLTGIDYVQIATDDAHGVAKYLSRAEEVDIDGLALMAPESPQVRDAVARLLKRNIKVIQFLSGARETRHSRFCRCGQLCSRSHGRKIDWQAFLSQAGQGDGCC